MGKNYKNMKTIVPRCEEVKFVEIGEASTSKSALQIGNILRNISEWNNHLMIRLS